MTKRKDPKDFEKMGRPTKYKGEETIDKIDKYLARYTDEEYKLLKVDWVKSKSYEHRLKVKLPTLESYFKFVGISQSASDERCGLYPEYKLALKKIMLEQRARLLEKGLSWDYNPTIAKLILSHNHGMKETSLIWWDPLNPIVFDMSNKTLVELEELRKKYL